MKEERVARRYNRRAGTYDEEMISKFGEYYFKVIKRIIQFAEPRAEDVVVDIGAGTGAVSFAFAPRVRKVIAVDISEKMLEEARRKAEDANIENMDFVVGTFMEPNVSEQADIIVSNISFHNLTDEEKATAIKRMGKMLKDGGRLVLGDVIIFFDTSEKEADEVLSVIAEYLGRKRTKAIKELREVFKRKYPVRYEDLERMLKDAGFEIKEVDKIFSIIGIVKAVKTISQ